MWVMAGKATLVIQFTMLELFRISRFVTRFAQVFSFIQERKLVLAGVGSMAEVTSFFGCEGMKDLCQVVFAVTVACKTTVCEANDLLWFWSRLRRKNSVLRGSLAVGGAKFGVLLTSARLQ
jgi:hypothetical protein